MSETSKTKPRQYRINLELSNKQRRDDVLELIKLSGANKIAAVLLLAMSVALKLYRHKASGGTVILRGPRGAEEELKLL